MFFSLGGVSSISNSLYSYGLVASLFWPAVVAEKNEPAQSRGYSYGQSIPVTCLNRTIDGEHITDTLGKMQYIPFPTCAETSRPLALRYGISESVNCTIATIPDDLYHLLEYYVHADVPMSCRVPTEPLSSAGLAGYRIDNEDKERNSDSDSQSGASTDVDVLDTSSGPAYTPLTFALQGTLQTSHLHLWTDMNVLAHGIPSSAKGRKRGKKGSGYVVAGTAYSVPEFDVSPFRGTSGDGGKTPSREEADVAVSRAAREPWTAGHGTKVVRGEPLTFSLHVRWVEGGSAIGWPRTAEDAEGGGAVAAFVSKALFFALAASVGALVALYLERRRRTGWRGDGILGAPPRGKGSVGIVYGDGGRMNGYGGYSAASGAVAGGGGYGLGFMNGKRD
ncbi:hypothetical protein PHISP_06589 [Aspergillus sp. HF37]|nr:hypothetical protein PHISP_06589 [Aspergillus sp. HF37]